MFCYCLAVLLVYCRPLNLSTKGLNCNSGCLHDIENYISINGVVKTYCNSPELKLQNDNLLEHCLNQGLVSMGESACDSVQPWVIHTKQFMILSFKVALLCC